MNNRSLAIEISKHPLIKKLLEGKLATSSEVARLVVEELIGEADAGINKPSLELFVTLLSSEEKREKYFGKFENSEITFMDTLSKILKNPRKFKAEFGEIITDDVIATAQQFANPQSSETQPQTKPESDKISLTKEQQSHLTMINNFVRESLPERSFYLQRSDGSYSEIVNAMFWPAGIKLTEEGIPNFSQAPVELLDQSSVRQHTEDTQMWKQIAKAKSFSIVYFIKEEKLNEVFGHSNVYKVFNDISWQGLWRNEAIISQDKLKRKQGSKEPSEENPETATKPTKELSQVEEPKQEQESKHYTWLKNWVFKPDTQLKEENIEYLKQLESLVIDMEKELKGSPKVENGHGTQALKKFFSTQGGNEKDIGSYIRSITNGLIFPETNDKSDDHDRDAGNEEPKSEHYTWLKERLGLGEELDHDGEKWLKGLESLVTKFINDSRSVQKENFKSMRNVVKNFKEVADLKKESDTAKKIIEYITSGSNLEGDEAEAILDDIIEEFITSTHEPEPIFGATKQGSDEEFLNVKELINSVKSEVESEQNTESEVLSSSAVAKIVQDEVNSEPSLAKKTEEEKKEIASKVLQVIQDPEEPTKIDTTKIDALRTAYKEFNEEFFRKRFLYEQGTIIKALMKALRDVIKKEDRAAAITNESTLNEGEEVQVEERDLRNIQTAFRVLLENIREAKKRLALFKKAAGAGKIISSDYKRDLIETIQEIQDFIHELTSEINNLLPKNKLEEAETGEDKEPAPFQDVVDTHKKVKAELFQILGADTEAELSSMLSEKIEGILDALQKITHHFPSVNPFRRQDVDFDSMEEQFTDAVENVKPALFAVVNMVKTKGAQDPVLRNVIKRMKKFSDSIQNIFDIKSKFKDIAKKSSEEQGAVESTEEETSDTDPRLKEKVIKDYKDFYTNVVLKLLAGRYEDIKLNENIEKDVRMLESSKKIIEKYIKDYKNNKTLDAQELKFLKKQALIFKQAYEKLTGVESDYSKVLGGDFKKMFLKADADQFARVLDVEHSAFAAALLKVLAQDSATAKKVAAVIKSFTDERKQGQIIMGMGNASKVEQSIIDDAIESVLKAMSEMPKLKDLEGSFGDTIQVLLKDDDGRKSLEDLAKNMSGDGAEENAKKINDLLNKTEDLEKFINTQIGSLGNYQDDKADTIDVKPQDDEKAKAEKHVKDFAEYLFKHVRNPDNLNEVLGKRSTKDVDKLEKVFLKELHSYLITNKDSYQDYYEFAGGEQNEWHSDLEPIWEAWLKSEGGDPAKRKHETLNAYRGSLFKKPKLKGTNIQSIFIQASKDVPLEAEYESEEKPEERETGTDPFDVPFSEETAKKIVTKTEEVVNNLPDDLSSEEKVEQATEKVVQQIDVTNLMSDTTPSDIESEADDVSIEDFEDEDIFNDVIDTLIDDSSESAEIPDEEEEQQLGENSSDEKILEFLRSINGKEIEIDGEKIKVTGSYLGTLEDGKLKLVNSDLDKDFAEKEETKKELKVWAAQVLTKRKVNRISLITYDAGEEDGGAVVIDKNLKNIKILPAKETTQEQIANKLKPLIWETIRKNK
jgi:hypothetical protein